MQLFTDELRGIALALALAATANAATIRQAPSSNYIAFEAETEAVLVQGSPTRWETRADTLASGASALIASGAELLATSPHSFVVYSIKFATPGTYYLYYKWKADRLQTDQEPFAANSSWIAGRFGSFTTPGTDGREPFNQSASNLSSPPANNTYRWQKESDSLVYVVSAADVAAETPVTFTVGTRELGMIFDRFAFSTSATLDPAALNALVNSSTAPVGPLLVAASGSSKLDTVTVGFNRPLAAASVTRTNFSLSGGLAITSATLNSADAKTVTLKTSLQTPGTVYTVTVNNVTDTNGVAVAANSTVPFTAWIEVSGWVRRDLYLGIAGSTIEDLQKAAKFPNAPDRVEWIKSFDLDNDPFESNYGAQLSAFFHPPSTDVYEFFYSNDDEAGLLLSIDTTEDSLFPLGVVPPTAGFNDIAFFTFPPSLAAGQKYLLVGQLKQSSGDARLSVAARRNGSAEPASTLRPLSGAQVSVFVNPDLGAVTFVQPPTNVTAAAGSRARFSVRVSANENPIYYQWRVNGADILGATRPAYTTPVLVSEDSGKKYSVVIGVAGRDTTSQEATLTVVAGNPPAIEPFLGVNFTGAGSGIRGSLTAVDVAGVVPQANWNNLSRTNAEAISLANATGAASPVTITYASREQWHSGTGAARDADSLLLHGYINSSNAPGPATFTFNGVPVGNYHVLVYSVGFDSQTPYEQAYSIAASGAYPVFHGRAQTGAEFLQSAAYKPMSSTNPDARDSGNYVQFDNVTPASNGSIAVMVFTETSPPGNVHAPVVNAIQLVKVLVTPDPTLTFAPLSAGGFTISWTSAGSGLVLEASDALGSNANWLAVPGAANPVPAAGSVIVSAAGGTKFYRLAPPRPTLTVAKGAGGVLTVAWTNANGFALESSESLGAGANWTPVAAASNPVAPSGSINVTATGSGAIYRLRK